MDETLAKQMARTLALAATKEGGEMAMALLGVIRTVNRWKEEAPVGPVSIISVDKAVDDILTAIEKGMGLSGPGSD